MPDELQIGMSPGEIGPGCVFREIEVGERQIELGFDVVDIRAYSCL